jgi:hypothetical protein
MERSMRIEPPDLTKAIGMMAFLLSYLFLLAIIMR